MVSGVMTLAQGSGSSGIPAADEATQIANGQATYGTATSDAAQTMNTAQSLNANSQNVLNNVTGSANNAMNSVQNSANQNLQTYGSTFSPLQTQQAQMAQNYTSAANTSQREGQAVADSNAATQSSLANQRASLASEGVDPASVHGSALTQQAALTGAAQNAGAATNSVLQTQATGNQLVNQANQLGTQVGQMGTSGETAAAGIGSNTVANTNNTNNSNVNNLTAANSYLNTATGANNSATTAANDQFNQQQTAYQDVQQAQANQSSAMGGIATGAMAMMAAGGPVSARGALPMPIVPGTTDTKLAALTPGEFVLPKDVTEHLGHDKLHKLIDKTRADIAERKGIPMHHQLSSAHTSMGA
jgi:hypothetical protein